MLIRETLSREGKNGKVHLVKLQKFHSEEFWSVQILYPLSSDCAENIFSNQNVKETEIELSLLDKSNVEVEKTWSRKLIKMPHRLIL